ncbi:MAG: hypothetical protein AAFR73_05745 [Pseudomonadota bacterium]
MSLSRRNAAKLIVAGSAFVAAVPFSAPAEEDWANRLTLRLTEAMPPNAGASFSVSLERTRSKTIARITLTWPPGTRRRTVASDEGYAGLEVGAFDVFADILVAPRA